MVWVKQAFWVVNMGRQYCYIVDGRFVEYIFFIGINCECFGVVSIDFYFVDEFQVGVVVCGIDFGVENGFEGKSEVMFGDWVVVILNCGFMYFKSVGDIIGVGFFIDFFNYGGCFCQLWFQFQCSGVEVEEVQKELFVYYVGVSVCCKYRVQLVGFGRKLGVNDIVFVFEIYFGGLFVGSR